MQIRLRAIALAFLASVVCPPSSRAEWKDTLIRSIAPTLVNRGMNYLLRDRQSVTKQQPRSAQSYAAPMDQLPYQPRIERPTVGKSKGAPPKHLPPKPVISNEEMGRVASKSAAGSKSAADSSSNNSLLSVPPPPKSMVPPPPPGVPTGAILGLYPEELAQVASDELPQATKAVSPKPAPDFRKTR